MAFTKENFVELIVKNHPELFNVDGKDILEILLELIKTGVVEEGEVKITNFGSWRVVHKKERQVNNFKDKKTMILPSRYRITFYPSKIFRDKIAKRGNSPL